MVGSWEGPDKHTPPGPGDTPNPWVILGTQVPGRSPQILGKNLEKLESVNAMGASAESGWASGMKSHHAQDQDINSSGNPHPQGSLPKAESLLPSAVPCHPS